MKIAFTLNDKPVTIDVAPATLVADLLRETLGLTGTHIGCDTSQCGACTVLLDGATVKSCTLLAPALQGAALMTIEGLARPGGAGGLHPMQEAFHQGHGLQCGFRTPGMVMAAVAFAAANPSPTEEAVRRGLEGNICRCTGYQNIVASVIAGAAAMHDQHKSNSAVGA
jgi:carbon-monoxide dehydrogenase small subunit